MDNTQSPSDECELRNDSFSANCQMAEFKKLALNHLRLDQTQNLISSSITVDRDPAEFDENRELFRSNTDKQQDRADYISSLWR